MNKVAIAVFAVLLAALGGCASMGGDASYSAAAGADDASSPFPRELSNDPTIAGA